MPVAPVTEMSPGRLRTSWGMGTRCPWRKQLFLRLAGNAANQAAVFHLPPERTIVMGGHLKV